eukprot:TRINITY_DN4738_c0_g1_i1.p1 TRINITY_DN4738_c0_g1~~TRINITY_DN4738_c0_g1_i1.p1  ORF type:complete len:201 (-),score=4.10 TRINITY_DN4738_c0_g1_i1:158-760(-)
MKKEKCLRGGALLFFLFFCYIISPCQSRRLSGRDISQSSNSTDFPTSPSANFTVTPSTTQAPVYTCPANCSGGGTCDTSSGQCICFPDYTMYDCSYHKKSRLTAFLLSFFLGLFGVDRFYLGFKWQAALKLLLGILICCTCCTTLFFYKSTRNRDSWGFFIALFWCVINLATFCWWLLDLIIIGTGQLGDDNGVVTRDDM